VEYLAFLDSICKQEVFDSFTDKFIVERSTPIKMYDSRAEVVIHILQGEFAD
jgi:hypothetical protein